MRSGAKIFTRRVLSFLLCFALIFPGFSLFAVAQDYPVSGMLTGDGVAVRNAPGTYDTTVLVRVNSGQSVTVLGEGIDRDGDMWYKVSFSLAGASYEGYIFNRYIKILTPPPQDIPVTPNPDFQTQLASFPELYHEGLIAVHEKHPSWNFEAVNTGLDWAQVQALENRLGWSYINDGIISHYSTAPGSYDWETDAYFVKEGSNWYQAHPDLVAYYMDPRNFLNETDIFQFEKLAFSAATQTEENIAAMMKGTFMEGKTTVNTAGETVSYARAFLDAAYAAGVSAFHLVIRCIQEVGWNGNACSLGTYVTGSGEDFSGYYNFFNIGAYTGAYDGMVYAKNQGWDTPYKAIMAGGSVIGNSYIARGQDTAYFQKYDVESPSSPVTHQYMTNIAAPFSEGRNQRKEYVELGMLESAFTFRIPVFQNMPTTPCPAPLATGSPNNFLKNLAVEGYSLTPTFDFYQTLNYGTATYDLIINGNVTHLNVSATPASSSAIVSGNIGQVPIQTGENTLKIICTSASGNPRVYTINVQLNGEGSASGPPDVSDPGAGSTVPSGWNPPYKISGNLISGITPGTDSSAFLSSLGVYGNASAYLTDAAGNVVSGAMRTGMILHYNNGAYVTQYQIVIYGDVNGDAGIDAIDLLLIRKNLLGLTAFNEAALKSADVNHDGIVDAIDLLLVRKTLLGLTGITQ